MFLFILSLSVLESREGIIDRLSIWRFHGKYPPNFPLKMKNRFPDVGFSQIGFSHFLISPFVAYRNSKIPKS